MRFWRGGFWDCRWDKSATGTTLDFHYDFLEAITIPVIINSIGYHEYPNETTKLSTEKFKCHLEHILSKDNFIITVRNDGSLKRICNRYGNSYSKKILEVPDPAFFNLVEDDKLYNRSYLGMCITNDLFSQEFNGELDENRFNIGIASYINKLLDNGEKVILIPHAPQDIETISIIYQKIDNKHKRNSLLIAPLDNCSEDAINTYISWYNKCKVIIGMRFHSCILGLILNIPTIALAGHAQIYSLYEEIGLSKYIAKVEVGFDKKLDFLLNEVNGGKSRQLNVQNSICEKYKKEVQIYRNTLNHILNKKEG